MKLLLFFTYNTSLKDWSSSGFLEREAKYYDYLSRKHNIDFTFVTYGDEEDIEIAESRFKFNVIPVYKYKKKMNNKILRFLHSFSIPFFIKKLNLDFDLIKTNQLNGAWVPIFFRFLVKKPLIVRTGYDIYSFKVKEQDSTLKIKFYFYLTKFSLIFSDVYFSTSLTDINNLKTMFPKYKEKLVLVPNWVEDKKSNTNNSIKVDSLISVGRLEKQKNFAGLIKSLEKSDFELNLVGKGSLEKELKNLATRLNVNVNFIGAIPHGQLIKLLNNINIYISTSSYEGNPKSILEAMNSGCVVIANETPNINEIIENNKNGILFNIEKESLNEILSSLIVDSSKLENISEAAFLSVQKKNSLSTVTKKEISEYQKLII